MKCENKQNVIYTKYGKGKQLIFYEQLAIALAAMCVCLCACAIGIWVPRVLMCAGFAVRPFAFVLLSAFASPPAQSHLAIGVRYFVTVPIRGRFYISTWAKQSTIRWWVLSFFLSHCLLWALVVAPFPLPIESNCSSSIRFVSGLLAPLLFAITLDKQIELK